MGYEPIQIRKSARNTAPHWVVSLCSMLVSTPGHPSARNAEKDLIARISVLRKILFVR